MKKIFAIIGIICGCVVILLGILLLSGAFGGEMASTTSSYPYDSGYSVFGADFYTYVNNNAAKAGDGAIAAAHNERVIGELLSVGTGILTIAFGLFMGCFFGMKLGIMMDKEKEKKTIVPLDDSIAVSENETDTNTEVEETVEGIAENPKTTDDSEKNDVSIEVEETKESVMTVETDEKE